MPFIVGMPNTGASHNSFYSLKGFLCCVVPRKFFAFVSHELLHQVYLIRVSFDEFSILIRETKKAHQLVLCLWRLPCKDCLNCVWIWSDTMLVHHPFEIFHRVLQASHFEGLHFNPALFKNANTSCRSI